MQPSTLELILRRGRADTEFQMPTNTDVGQRVGKYLKSIYFISLSCLLFLFVKLQTSKHGKRSDSFL